MEIFKQLEKSNKINLFNTFSSSSLDIEFNLVKSIGLQDSYLVRTLRDNFDNYLEILSSIIINKFSDKWNRVYLVFTTEYDFLSNYKLEKTMDVNTINNNKYVENSDDKINNFVNQSTNYLNKNFKSAFNSLKAVETDNVEEETTINSDGEKNYKTGMYNSTKNDTLNEQTSSTVIQSGNIGKDYQSMIEKEIELRKNNFLDIIYSDVLKLTKNIIY